MRFLPDPLPRSTATDPVYIRAGDTPVSVKQAIASALDTALGEMCNGIDDDCDGTTDELYILGGSITYTDLNGASGLVKGNNCGTGVCAGGTVVCQGAPEAIAACTDSLTGKHLKPKLK